MQKKFQKRRSAQLANNSTIHKFGNEHSSFCWLDRSTVPLPMAPDVLLCPLGNMFQIAHVEGGRRMRSQTPGTALVSACQERARTGGKWGLQFI
ncbi:hypothetical protein GLAREA_10845 [Glarea lozoyensis ATCC 20868]|uniref:Uncharacterized protein n=1 Tax=Glarea lozoyensis (strain ATCC 20868 / MF5171) TaxID=1116229 RepID=S3DDG8_GLAL2|nr:uncharacterized protein GLAREA_10845 [Glarea lozoyensis ATCC 20868]EPE35149.1 hypothetical protein GLAREA_10845 [Glarea lozoyensis ATCC 20868]